MDGRENDGDRHPSHIDLGDSVSTASHRSGGAVAADTDQQSSTRRGALISEDDATVIAREPPIAPKSNVRYLEPRELGAALVGDRLDHFELIEFIGGGGMGAVFRAHDTLLDRVVAVKVLASGESENDDMRLRFHKEAQSAARLDHANIARVHYVGEAKGVHYIVFEYIEGANLRELVVSHGVLSIEQALGYTVQVADALAHAWDRDVVHRDIKPSNILVMPDGQAKLVDMGLARMQQLGGTDDDLTESGVTLGTFDYISPEQARDPRSADTRSDIYSLGCTLYFMLCGEPPFSGGTVLQKLLQHQESAPPDPRGLRPDLSPEISLLIRKMLAKSPDERFQSPMELVGAILATADQMGVVLARPTTTVPVLVNTGVEALIRRHAPWILPATILIAIVATMDIWGRRQSFSLNPSDLVIPPTPTRMAPPTTTSPSASETPTSGSRNPLGLPPEPSESIRSQSQVHESPSKSLRNTNSGSGSRTESVPASSPLIKAVESAASISDETANIAKSAADSVGGRINGGRNSRTEGIR